MTLTRSTPKRVNVVCTPNNIITPGFDVFTSGCQQRISAARHRYPGGMYDVNRGCEPAATEADINALTPGLYIINGKKVMIRR